MQGWAKLVLIVLERYSVALKRLTFNLRYRQGHLNVIRTNVIVCLVNSLRFNVQKKLIPLTFYGFKALIRHTNLTLYAYTV